MARLLNDDELQIINYHSTGNTLPEASDLELGEFAVLCGEEKQAIIWKTSDDKLVSVEPINVIKDKEEFETLEEEGKVLDALVLKEVIEEDEHVTAAALNDLDARVLDNKSSVDSMKSNITSINDSIDEIQDDIYDIYEQLENVDAGLTIEKLSSSTDPTVRDEYRLKNKNGDTLGDTIKVYKDNSFVGGSVGKSGSTINPETGAITDGTGDNVLRLVYINNQGKYVLVEISMSDIAAKAIYNSGVTSTNGVVHGVVNTTKDENFLFVDGGGFYVSGVTKAISNVNDKILALDYTDTAQTGKYVSSVSQVDGKISVEHASFPEVITTEAAFSALTETGKFVDAKVVRDVIVDDEQVFSAAINDLNDRIIDTTNRTTVLETRVTDLEDVLNGINTILESVLYNG